MIVNVCTFYTEYSDIILNKTEIIFNKTEIIKKHPNLKFFLTNDHVIFKRIDVLLNKLLLHYAIDILKQLGLHLIIKWVAYAKELLINSGN